MSSHAPPGTGTVYRAVLDTLADHGPRRAPLAQVARLAATNRQFLYRNWPSPEALFQDACAMELERLLYLAREVDDAMPPPCLLVAQIVRATRLLREHPVTRATARTSPDLTLAALARRDTSLHHRALNWLLSRLEILYVGPDRKALAEALFTVAAPFALVPPPSHEPTDRASLDIRLSSALHCCLNIGPACANCQDP
ncbi:TetR/AcrR family transcriptional regulator [Streptomyces sp. NPDC002577]